MNRGGGFCLNTRVAEAAAGGVLMPPRGHRR
jgi:hypothetical protein